MAPSLLHRGHSVDILVFPTVVDKHRHAERRAAIRQTWGRAQTVGKHWQVRTFFVEKEISGRSSMAGDSLTNWEEGGDLISPIDLTLTAQFIWSLQQVEAARGKSKLWAKSRSWYFKADTLTFVIPENLVYLLNRPRRRDRSPVYLGRKLRTEAAPQGTEFFSGGAGWAMSGAAVQMLLKAWGTGCEKIVKADPYLQGAPDMALNRCFGPKMPLHVARTPKDEEYFHVFSPLRTVLGSFDPWYTKYSANANLSTRGGLACCAARSVSFHYVEGPAAIFFHSVLHNPATWRNLSPKDRFARWPGPPSGGDWRVPGGYDRVPLRADDAGSFLVWQLLLDKLKLTSKSV